MFWTRYVYFNGLLVLAGIRVFSFHRKLLSEELNCFWTQGLDDDTYIKTNILYVDRVPSHEVFLSILALISRRSKNCSQTATCPGTPQCNGNGFCSGGPSRCVSSNGSVPVCGDTCTCFRLSTYVWQVKRNLWNHTTIQKSFI